MTDKKKMVCRECGSEDVRRDAWAEWDVGEQEWTLSDVYDAAYCNTCEADTKIDEEEVDDA